MYLFTYVMEKKNMFSCFEAETYKVRVTGPYFTKQIRDQTFQSHNLIFDLRKSQIPKGRFDSCDFPLYSVLVHNQLQKHSMYDLEATLEDCVVIKSVFNLFIELNYHGLFIDQGIFLPGIENDESNILQRSPQAFRTKY